MSKRSVSLLVSARLISDSRHDSWQEPLEKPLSQFFISVNHSGKRCEEVRRRRRRSWRQNHSQDILPPLVRVTERPETCWRSGQDIWLGREVAGWRVGIARTDKHTRSHACLRQIKFTDIYNAQCLSICWCTLLCPQENRQKHCALSDNPVGVLFGQPYLRKSNKSDGMLSTTSQSQFINTESGEEMLEIHR